ncbi:tRNA lysidine(34) synthetase TilS [Tengunoibacter tsumagoiensis]|uniref:tRNA(Ile)-lysidine synthase n=1 Tax=Tengunoibacter tsumagoiensis TaxID=2014871 RepID=A0A401ZVY0_9CHLR|nr:tRNA lysidine(34) synthetase TilS [Tengunoibacter tsumagoiensis]GCE11059.1 tRNA(Ile)-lysidine synthase [Tengunoibacter tsumagoiensis]
MLAEIVRTMLEDYHLLPASGKVVVAVSGGADSLCLLHVLHQLCGPHKRYPSIQLHVAHLNHQLRGEASLRDASEVARLAASWDLPVSIGSTDVSALAQEEHCSLEEAARTARYRFLRQVAQGQPIAVAHHKDDQAETLVLHWLRGGGLASMVGLQPRQQDILRPLLGVTHEETVAYCAEHGLVPLEDASNSDLRFLRNRIRHEILPLLSEVNPGLRETLVRNAEVMQVDLAWLEEQVSQHWPTVVRHEEPEMCELSISAFQMLPLSLQRHLLRRTTAALCSGQSPLELRHYRLLEELLQRPHSWETVTLHLPHQLRAVRQAEMLRLERIQASETFIVPQTDEIHLHMGDEKRLPGTPWLVSARYLEDELAQEVRQALQQNDWSQVWRLLPSTRHTVFIDISADISSDSSTDVSELPSQAALLVRTWQAGDRMQPLGMLHTKKIQDILVDTHVPRSERTQIPLFFFAHQCIWLAGVQIAETVRLRPYTQQIICLSIRKVEP